MKQITELELKHNEMLTGIASECTVLLKKDGNFPIEKPCKIALYGNGARRTLKGGTGSGGVNSRFYVTVEQGLERAGFTVTTKDWLDAYDENRDSRHIEFLESIKAKAAKTGVSMFVAGFGAIEPEYEYDIPMNGEGDAAVYVLARTSGEGSDRRIVKGDVLLTGTEIRNILYLKEKFDKFILVLNVGGVVDLTPVLSVPNILYLSQLGVVTGDVLANILLGKAYPSGKLTTTWANPEDYCGFGSFGELNDTRYNEGVYVGYRYFDTVQKEPYFPFGYGLSYTDFDIRFISIKKEKSKITVQVSVKNIGKFVGKEVVQLYVSSPIGKIAKPEKSLVAFAKTDELAVGEEQQISLAFDFASVASYDTQNARYILEEGEYVIKIGNSSRNTINCVAVNILSEISVKKVKNLTAKPDFEDACLLRQQEKVMGIPSIELSTDDFDIITIGYELNEKTHPLVEKLTEEQLAYLCVGAHVDQTTGGIIGGSSLHVAGAAGETTNRITDVLDNKYVVMADGPAGLRITREYIREEDGRATPVIKELPDGLGEILDPSVTAYLRRIYENTPKDKLLEQYTTAIPIGTAIAQSWNVTVGELCGDIVGAEMQQFGVQLWLAPALNIHRNILCGRNFEYYSEDPYVSGMMAASLVRGVQKHEKCGATIKHFAANNQETNRYNNNSIVSERALREIYLKGFEICIKESQPKTLMTSYNLINGVHTSESRELVTDVLRSEFGFKGVVMTDWITTGVIYNKKSTHPPVYSSNIVKAGNDLTMAGSEVDMQDLKLAVSNGKITRKELSECASRVLRLIEDLN